MTNPLLKAFDTPFSSVPFTRIQDEHYEPAIRALIDEARRETDAITGNSQTPDFENTIAALEKTGKQLGIASSVFFNLNSAETNDFLEETAQKISPLLASHSNDVMLNEELFARVKYVWEHMDTTALDPEDARLLDKTYKGFIRNGAMLGEAEKARIREIDQELSVLGVQFAQNVLRETNDYTLHFTDRNDLEGLPESAVQAAAEEAAGRSLEGWVFTLQFPSLTPFLKYARKRTLRQELHFAAGRKAFQDNENNNEANIRRITVLRRERAQLLGFTSHADFVLQERMAGSTEKVVTFLRELMDRAKPFAESEIRELADLAAQDGIDRIMPWDHAYYAEKLREAKYAFSEEELKPYFPLQQVQQAAFDAAGRLYGLSFVLRDDVETYHPEVTVYEVLEQGQHKALLYTDYFPRKGKRPGAWMTSWRGQYRDGAEHVRPHISIVCNFSRPVGELPSLLTFTEVTTMFHEFGHALHGILADTRYESLSGTNVYWDFVELPSQFMENYCYEKSFLNDFARHHRTGEALPEDKVDKIVQAAHFMQGYQTLRQIGFGLLDMAYHTNGLPEGEDIAAFETRTTGETRLYPDVIGTAISPSFSHIFAGGYAAGYYSYKWAEVLDADAFAYFKETDIFAPETAVRFKKLLSSGGTVDPMALYVAFRGREPQPDALLKRAGLVSA